MPNGGLTLVPAFNDVRVKQVESHRPASAEIECAWRADASQTEEGDVAVLQRPLRGPEIPPQLQQQAVTDGGSVVKPMKAY